MSEKIKPLVIIAAINASVKDDQVDLTGFCHYYNDICDRKTPTSSAEIKRCMPECKSGLSSTGGRGVYGRTYCSYTELLYAMQRKHPEVMLEVIDIAISDNKSIKLYTFERIGSLVDLIIRNDDKNAINAIKKAAQEKGVWK